jgi:hypothetical protein
MDEVGCNIGVDGKWRRRFQVVGVVWEVDVGVGLRMCDDERRV